MLWLAILAVWVTRKILWVLLYAGHAIAGLTMRQMEFDADRYEARFAGSDAFERTSRRLQELGVGMQMAYSQLGSSHREGRLVDDLPALTRINSGKLPDEIKKELDKAYAEGKTGWFDSHPCDKDRVANAKAEEAQGVVTVDAPATTLFTDFAAQSKATTWEYYREVFGPQLKKTSLEPIAKLMESEEKMEAADKRLASYYAGAARAHCALPLRSGHLTRPESPKAVAAQLKTARAAVEEAAPDAREQLKRMDKAKGDLVTALQLESPRKAGFKIGSKAVEERFQTEEGCRRVRDKARLTINQATMKLEGFQQSLADRLFAACELLLVDQVAEKLSDGGESRRRVEACLPVLVAIDGQMESLKKLFECEAPLGAVVGALQGQPDDLTINEIDRLVGHAHPAMTQVREVLIHHDYPFDHKSDGVTMGAFVLPDPIARADLSAVVNAMPEMTDRLFTVRRRLLGELASVAEKVEALLGLKPLPQPPTEEGEAAAA
ncbi:MAG: hypothetical protein AAGJ46_11245 [Planctomycetota bacterium]